MNTPLQNILSELYAIDPAFEKHEKDLIPLIETLLRHNPGQQPDEHFVEELRMHLREKAASLSMDPSSASSSLFHFLTMKNFSYAALGAVTAVIITIPTVQFLNQNNPAVSPSQSEGALFSYSVKDAGTKAFGDLSTVSTDGGMGRGGGGGGMATGGNTAEIAADAPAMAPTPVDAQNQKMGYDTMPPMEYVDYEFIIDGAIPALTSETVEVYKRQKGLSAVPLSSLASTFNIGMIDLTSFASAQVESVNFYEPKPYGYVINVALKEGSISVNQNWEQWPHPEEKCRDEACYRSMQLKIEQLPGDDAIIAIADAFIKDHQIDVSKYGKPEVDMSWKFEYDRATDKTMAYIPETQRVVYPLLIDGQTVEEEWGGKVGISVGVSVREKKVADMWGLMNQNLLKSSYPAVTDEARIRDFIQKTDQYLPLDQRPSGVKTRTVKVTLGAPVLGYTKMYSYDKGQSEELMTPALIFPVLKAEGEQYYYRRTITVPLAEEIFKSRTQPMMEGGGGVMMR